MVRVISATLVALFGLGAVLEAAYLERPLWLTAVGRAASVPSSNLESYGQQPIPERAESLQWPQDMQYAVEQNAQRQRGLEDTFLPSQPMMESIPMVGFFNSNQQGPQMPHFSTNQHDSEDAKSSQTKPEPEFRMPYFEQQSWEGTQPRHEEAPPMQYKAPEVPSYQPNPVRPEVFQPIPEIQYQAPFFGQRPLEGPQHAQPSQPMPEAGYMGQRTLDAPLPFQPSQPKPEGDYQMPYFGQRPLDGQQPFQPTLPKPEGDHQMPYFGQQPFQPTLPKPEGDHQMPYFGQQPFQPSQPKPESDHQMPYFGQQPFQPSQPKPEGDHQMPYFGQRPLDGQQPFQPTLPKPEEYQPAVPKPEPFQPKPDNFQTNPMTPEKGYDLPYQPQRPLDVQQSFKPSPVRPNVYQPNQPKPEPEYQMHYYGQHPLESQQPFRPNEPKPEPERQWSGQIGRNDQPAFQPNKPSPNAGQPEKPKPENQTPFFGQDSMSNSPSYYPQVNNEPVQNNHSPQPQGNRQPQPPRNMPRPNRPVERAPEMPQYQLNRLPASPWESQYQPDVQQPLMPNSNKNPVVIPRPPQRPQILEQPSTYNRRPEMFYDDNDDDEVAKYEQVVSRADPRCPRNDNPSKPVHFASPNSCVKFQKCFNGVAYEMSCPKGLEFDYLNNRCDYPAKARCSQRSP